MTTNLRPDQGSVLAPSFEHATVGDVMCAGVVSCRPDAPAVEVARIMAARHLHAVVVAGIEAAGGYGERLTWHVVTDTDLLRAAAGEGLEGRTAADLHGATPVSVAPGTPLSETAHLMVEHNLTHVVVADGGHPVGVVSTLDVAGVLAWGRG
jgi:CBS domain-containing protein